MNRLAEIRLDPLGGIAGDMFAAALADAFPECVPGLMRELAKISPTGVRLVSHADAVLRGQRFVVDVAPAHHHHVAYRDIRTRLRAAGLAPEVLRHALGLFGLLAKVEGEVHGVEPDEVEFHEVGALDSILDFVAAGYFIATLAPERWSFGPLPLGGGRVQTAHGILPVPAPATALLMRGLEVIDDGIQGERVTPTGAAIARYLGDLPEAGAPSRATPTILAATGNGFGSRALPGVSNVLRCLAFAPTAALPSPLDEEVATLTFEIDDQTAEDLAVALERIRKAEGVLDACQLAVHGKKGRMATQVQVLVRPDSVDAIVRECLSQTTTLGVRIARLWRRKALRTQVTTAKGVRVKVAERPEGEVTAKAEIDDLARAGRDRAGRQAARGAAEAEALEATRSHEPDRKDD